MRKLAMIGAVAAFCMLSTSAGLPGAAEVWAGADSSGIRMSVDGQLIAAPVQPKLLNGSLFVPLRELTTALGAVVGWDDGASTATIAKDDTVLKFTVGSSTAERNGEPIAMGAAPVMESGSMLVPIRLISESFQFNVYWDGANQSVDVMNPDDSLPTVGSVENFTKLMEEAGSQQIGFGGRGGAIEDRAVFNSAAGSSAAGSAPAAAPIAPESAKVAAKSTTAGSAPSYSQTNVQVEGVDESDIVKTDGTYIYQLSRSQNKLYVSEAYPAESMKVVSSLKFGDDQFYPQELYVDDKRLIVIGSASLRYNMSGAAESGAAVPADTVRSSAGVSAKIAVMPAMRQLTKAIVYDLSDRSNLKKVREIDLDGYYVSSRKIGSSLYLVANKGFSYYRVRPLPMPMPVPMAEPAVSSKSAAGGGASGSTGSSSSSGSSITEKPAAPDTPSYRDSLAGDHFIQVGLEDIRYFPKSIEPNYMIVAGLNLDNPDEKVNVSTYLGSGQKVYASQNNLYVALQKYEPVQTDIGNTSSPVVSMSPSTTIYKFGLASGKVTYSGKGTVPGSVKNQFSMDEQDGYFRIATTSGEAWRNDQYTSKNNMYVLNEKLEMTGQIEDIAPGEQIYSVRFAGNRAYMVTFRTVDPLFVIDLKDPKAPAILGQLKIPGYSDYLHPYDENHIIGFGKDAVEVSNPYGGSGTGGSDTMAYYQGMKLALFDVTDVTKPVELFKESIGDRGTQSELLNDHKALLFNKDNGLLAFPVSVAEIKDKASLPANKLAAAYGQTVFEGAYVYHLDLKDGFKFRGTITHQTADDISKAGNRGMNYEHKINRILYIGDNLYTTSNSMLKANDLNSLKEIKALDLK